MQNLGIILSFLLGLTLFLFTSFFINKNEEEKVGRYRLYPEEDGQVTYILDTQKGSFKTYISEIGYRRYGDSPFRYLLVDEADPISGKKKLDDLLKDRNKQ